MTRPRIYGEDLPFGGWLWATPDLDSVEFKLTATDRDFKLHKYRDNCDGVGPRQVQLMMALEVKTYGGMPDRFQQQSIFFEHQLLEQEAPSALQPGRRSEIRLAFRLLCAVDDGDGAGPLGFVTWVRFEANGCLHARTIPIWQSIEIRGSTYGPIPSRRYTCDAITRRRGSWQPVTAPLGFEDQKPITRRS